MSEQHSAEDYRRRAADMKAQAGRAETVYLQMLYASIADNWEQLAAQMQAADRAHQNRGETHITNDGDDADSNTKH